MLWHGSMVVSRMQKAKSRKAEVTEQISFVVSVYGYSARATDNIYSGWTNGLGEQTNEGKTFIFLCDVLHFLQAWRYIAPILGMLYLVSPIDIIPGTIRYFQQMCNL